MDRYYEQDITVTGGTTPTNPATTNIALENALLVDVEILIPPGHNALTGVRIRQSRQQIIPWGNNSWISADNYSRIFDVNSEIGSKAISVQTYNNDTFDHTFYMRFHIRELRTDTGSTASGSASGLIGLSGSLDGIADLPGLPLPPLPLPPILPPGMVPPSLGGDVSGTPTRPAPTRKQKALLLD